MKIDFSAITPVSYSKDSVEGVMGGMKITVSRKLDGWTPVLEVIMDGHRVHLAPCNDLEEQRAFNRLREAAYNVASNANDAARAAVLQSEEFKKIFMKG